MLQSVIFIVHFDLAWFESNDSFTFLFADSVSLRYAALVTSIEFH
jgi:hypothetical protein